MFLPGRLLEIGPATFSTGGPVSNTGLALHTLGISTKLMGKVGDDVFGQTITRLVAAYDPHLAEGMIVDKTASSSYTIVVNPPGCSASRCFSSRQENWHHYHLRYGPT
jgi:sugar/nucleoside kinase (ribokinase family)